MHIHHKTIGLIFLKKNYVFLGGLPVRMYIKKSTSDFCPLKLLNRNVAKGWNVRAWCHSIANKKKRCCVAVLPWIFYMCCQILLNEYSIVNVCIFYITYVSYIKWIFYAQNLWPNSFPQRGCLGAYSKKRGRLKPRFPGSWSPYDRLSWFSLLRLPFWWCVYIYMCVCMNVYIYLYIVPHFQT